MQGLQAMAPVIIAASGVECSAESRYGVCLSPVKMRFF
jgi:hypothetical protein